MSDQEVFQLADEIEARGLKFADVKEGHHEILSEEEREVVVAALRAWASYT